VQPEILSHILDLKTDNPLVLRPAFIEGYSLRHWGQYRTLIDGPPLNVVEGVAYLVRSEADLEKLAYYGTKASEAAPCMICFKDGSDVNEKGKCEKQEKKVPTMVRGKTFVYAGLATRNSREAVLAVSSAV